MSAVLGWILSSLHQGVEALRHLPVEAWALAVPLSVALWPLLIVTYSLVSWTVDRFRRNGERRRLKVLDVGDGTYILVNNSNADTIAADSNGGKKLVSKETALKISCNGRSAKGTIRYTQSQKYDADTIGLPSDIAKKLNLNNLDREDGGKWLDDLNIRVAKRFVLENLWNNPDIPTRLGFRTAVWIAAVTTAVSIAVTAMFEYVLCRECIQSEPHAMVSAGAPAFIHNSLTASAESSASDENNAHYPTGSSNSSAQPKTRTINQSGLQVSPETCLRGGQHSASDTTPPPSESGLCSAIYFPWGNSDVLAEHPALVKALVRKIATDAGNHTIVIAGFTDASGEHYQELSRQRACSAESALEAAGYAPSSIVAIAQGANFPAVETNSGVREPLNRRVEIAISPTDKIQSADVVQCPAGQTVAGE